MKPIRDGKIVYNNLLNTAYHEAAMKATAPIIQICELQAQTSLIYSSRNVLYIAIPQNKLKIISSISYMENFVDTPEYLYKIVVSLY